MQSEVNDILERSLQKAREHDRTGNVGKAYAYYTIVMELSPSKRSEIEEIFTDVLCEWGIQLAEKNRFSDVVRCYKYSLDIYPNNPRMLNNFAAHLLRNNDPTTAIEYLRRALKVDSNFLPAERNLQNAFSMAVDRWHFTMLNDKCRNNAFEQAICKKISQGYNTVLDVGTGTGLLSLYAMDAGAMKIYACECSEVMTKIAREVFKSNNATNIKLIPKLSFDLKIPTDIPERVQLIVTETFDAGLFGEFVVPSMINMHMNILDLNGTIIPMGATVYTTAIECEYIRHRSSVIFEKMKDSCLLNFDNVSVLPDDEYYDTENLEKVQINYITEPQKLFRVNFNNLLELQALCEDGIKQTLQTKCRYNGVVDGLVTWFKLHLDEEITLDSSDKKSCWQLAVFPAMPTICHEGDIVTIKAEMLKNKLKCSYNMNSNEEIKKKDCKFLYHLPKEVIVFLNDFDYVKLLTEVGRSQKNRKIKYILDTSPFPIYGLTILKEFKDSELLYYKSDNPTLRSFIEQVAQDNKLQKKVRLISSYDEILFPLDSILVHNFDIKGELGDGQDRCQKLFRYLLKPDSMLLPEKIFVMGQLVYSEDLPNMVYVQDTNLQRSSLSSNTYIDKNSDNEDDLRIQNNKISKSTNYVIAEHINQYKINQIFDLNSSLYSCEILSEPQVLIEISETETTEAIVNFGKISNTKKSILPNALICWYKIQLNPNHVHDTKKNDSFMNHTAIVFEDELKDVITKDKEVKIKAYQMKGLVKLAVLHL